MSRNINEPGITKVTLTIRDRVGQAGGLIDGFGKAPQRRRQRAYTI